MLFTNPVHDYNYHETLHNIYQVLVLDKNSLLHMFRKNIVYSPILIPLSKSWVAAIAPTGAIAGFSSHCSHISKSLNCSEKVGDSLVEVSH